MGEISAIEGASEQSLSQGFKQFWSERFRILESYRPYIRRQNPLPPWSASDVEEFIASDPVHGPIVWLFFHIYMLFFLWFLYLVTSIDWLSRCDVDWLVRLCQAEYKNPCIRIDYLLCMIIGFDENLFWNCMNLLLGFWFDEVGFEILLNKGKMNQEDILSIWKLGPILLVKLSFESTDVIFCVCVHVF